MCALLAWNLNLRAGYWQICIDPWFRQHWGSLGDADCSVCGGIKQHLSVNLMPAAVFVGSEVIKEMKGMGGFPDSLLQVFYGFQGVGIRNTCRCTLNSKRLCQGQHKKMGLMNKSMNMGHTLGQEQRWAFKRLDKRESGLLKYLFIYSFSLFWPTQSSVPVWYVS